MAIGTPLNGRKLPCKAPESRYSLRKGTRKRDSGHWLFARSQERQRVGCDSYFQVCC